MSDHEASMLQMKNERQRKALDILNRKVTTQRFRLNLLKELGRDVTYEEYVQAKKDLAERNEAHAERVDEYEVLTVE